MFGRGEKAGREEFERELLEMVTVLYNCPCIAMWVPFNEGWGQFDAARMCEVIRGIDDTRTIDHASGWHDQRTGELQSLHVYFKNTPISPTSWVGPSSFLNLVVIIIGSAGTASMTRISATKV